jgi:hypothetical protein
VIVCHKHKFRCYDIIILDGLASTDDKYYDKKDRFREELEQVYNQFLKYIQKFF